MHFAREYPQFVTGTCLNWKLLLQNDSFKNILIDSFRFLTTENRINLFAFVIMNNHFHLIWQLLGNHIKQDVQRDFMKFTAQQILWKIEQTDPYQLIELRVDAKDRKYQVWERNSRIVSLTQEKFFIQKLNYIHQNPVKAGICMLPEQYKYSSARFYICNEHDWDFLAHYKG